MTYVGRRMRRYFSWYTPDRPRPIRTVAMMLRYHDFSETDNISECSYLKFTDSEVVESVHHYMLVKEA